jgi:hypothetical protein
MIGLKFHSIQFKNWIKVQLNLIQIKLNGMQISGRGIQNLLVNMVLENKKF